MKTYQEYREEILNEPSMTEEEIAADIRSARAEFFSSISSARDLLWREISEEEATYELGDAHTTYPVFFGEMVYPDALALKTDLIETLLGPTTVQLRFHDDVHPAAVARECMKAFQDNTGARLVSVYDAVCDLDGLGERDAETVIDTISDEAGRTLEEWLDIAGFELGVNDFWHEKR